MYKIYYDIQMGSDVVENKISERFAEWEVIDIANAVTKHSYSISKLGMNDLFKKMTAADYVTLNKLLEKMNGNESGRLYLSEISSELMMPIARVSRLARALQERGLVVWKHDGTGEEGTYIQITDNGVATLEQQQQVLSSFYADVIEKFGKERFLGLLSELAALEEVMGHESN